MMNELNKALNRYLATGEVPTQDAALVIIGHGEDSMFSILVSLAIIEMLSKDLHYRAAGKPFFAIHEMADIIWKMGRHRDDINEIYYMGENQSEPPMAAKVCGAAAQKVVQIFGGRPVTSKTLMESLHIGCLHLAEKVERIKEERKLSSGTAAILDEVSKDSLMAAGFLKRTLSGADMTSPDDADVKVTVTGPVPVVDPAE